MKQGTGAPMVILGGAESGPAKPKGPSEVLSPSNHSHSSLKASPLQALPLGSSLL